jgi:hypothetical protein
MTHDTAVNVEVYPHEFKPLLKLINRALISNDVMEHINEVEAHHIYCWLADFQSKALEHSI